MMKRIKPLPFLLLFIILACNQNKSGNTTDDQEIEVQSDSISVIEEKIKIQLESNGVFFKANGAVPFWTLELSENMFKLKTVEDSVMTPPSIPKVEQEGALKTYVIKTELIHLDITLERKQCIASASGMSFPYTVTITKKYTGSEESIVLSGCGEYKPDYRLHDIWVLESLNGSNVSKEDFGKELPLMEIKISNNTFSGSTGCNRMSGQLVFEHEAIGFKQIITTKMACLRPDNKEQEFLSLLQQAQSYTIANNRLTLTNGEGTTLVFKKID